MFVTTEQAAIGKAITDPLELVHRHPQGLENALEGLAEVGPGEPTVMLANQFDPILTRNPATADV